MQTTLQVFIQDLSEAIAERVKLSKDPQKEALTLADLTEIIKRAIDGKQEWRPEPGYPKRISKVCEATNGGSLSQRQLGLGPPMTTFYRVVSSPAEEKQAREEGWS